MLPAYGLVTGAQKGPGTGTGPAILRRDGGQVWVYCEFREGSNFSRRQTQCASVCKDTRKNAGCVGTSSTPVGQQKTRSAIGGAGFRTTSDQFETSSGARGRNRTDTPRGTGF